MAEMDLGGTTKATDIKGRGKDPAPGSYIVAVKDVKWNEKLDCEVVELEVWGGTTTNQVGCETALFLKYEKEGVCSDRHKRFALAAELIRPGVKANVDFEFFRAAIGRFLVIRMEEFKKKDSDESGVSIGSFGLDVWSPLDPEVVDIVRHMDGKAAAVMQRLTGGTQAAATQPAMAAAGNGAAAAPADWGMV